MWAGDNKVYAARIRHGFAVFADGSKGRVERVTCKKMRARASLVAFPPEYAAVNALASLRDACSRERFEREDTLKKASFTRPRHEFPADETDPKR